MKAGSLQFIERRGQVEKIAPRRHSEDGKGSGNSEAPAARGSDTTTIVHEKQIGLAHP